MELINLSIDNRGVARVVLNRPDKLNAFSRALCDAYLLTLGKLESQIASGKVRLVMLDSSSDKAFCAGADLKERAAMDEKEIDEQLRVQRQMMDRTESLKAPTVAVLRGVAFGGGLELALSCDFRLARDSVQLGLTETKLAIIPGSGGTQRLTRLVGVARAKELIMLGRRIDARSAADLGIVNEVSENLDLLVESYVDNLLEAGPLALAAAKAAIQRAPDLALSEGLDFERSCYESVLRSQDRVEGLEAFMEKRKPRYSGN